MYPTIQVIGYLMQYFQIMFGQNEVMQWTMSQSINKGVSDKYSFLPGEALHLFPWNNCFYQWCSSVENATAHDYYCTGEGNYTVASSTKLDENRYKDLQDIWDDQISKFCKYSPTLYQFQKLKLQNTAKLELTEFYTTFINRTSDVPATASVYFDNFTQLFIVNADKENRYMCMFTFLFIAMITAIKPSLRHILFGIQYIIPLFGIILGCIYISLRGGMNSELLNMLFELEKDSEDETFIHSVGRYFKEPSNWAEAGIVTMTFHAIGTGVNIAFSSYNPRDNWVNLQGMVITCYAWVGNLIFMLFVFLNVNYMNNIMHNPERKNFYGLNDRVEFVIKDVMSRDAGGSYLFMATIADSLSFHKHSLAILPLMLMCIVMNSIGSIQAIIETMATSVYGAGFLNFSRIPSCLLVAALCAALSQVYALNTGFGFFAYQILEKFAYGWPVPILSAIMVIAGTWVYSMYRLNNAMFMYSMHHLHYYWMFVWPFIVPAGMMGMAIFRAILEFGSLLRTDMKYLGSATLESLEEDGITAENNSVLELYFQKQTWPQPIIYVSSAIYILYLAPFLFTFTLVGCVNCIKNFPFKPHCYDYYKEEEEEEVVDALQVTNLVQTPRQALAQNLADNISFGGASDVYSDIDTALTPSESEASVYTESLGTEVSSIEDPEDPFSVRRKIARRAEKARIEEERRRQEEERIRLVRELRVSEGKRATPTPDQSVAEEEGSEVYGSEDKPYVANSD